MTGMLARAGTLPCATPWVPYPAAGSPVVFCLPHAGGGAGAYRAWQGRLPGVAVVPLQPPGREERAREAAFTDVTAYARELAGVVAAHAAGRPYVIYGHSLGALVGFELVHELVRCGVRAPEHLVVSGSPAPDGIDTAGTPARDMSDDELVGLLRRLGGTPEAVLREPLLMELILPVIRADLTVKDTYRFRRRAPLDVPFTVIASDDDPRARPDQVEGWRSHTAAGTAVETLAGGHFAVLEQSERTLDVLGRVLCA